MDKLYIKKTIRDPSKFGQKNVPKIFLIIVICTQQVYSYCHLLLKLLYIVGKSSFLKEIFLEFANFMAIFL
jgi:hypothetical protein